MAAPKKPKLTDAEQVSAYMTALEHPLKAEVEAVRSIILQTDPRLKERIKWNAPSYYATADLVTFNLRMQPKVHLVFHHEAIVRIASPLLEGTYKDRRMMYFANMNEVETHRPELERILREYLELSEA